MIASGNLKSFGDFEKVENPTAGVRTARGNVMGHLLDWLLDKNNKETCRLVGIFLIIPPLAFRFAGGFLRGNGWFHEWFSGIFKLSLTLMFFLGLILILAGFSKRKSE